MSDFKLGSTLRDKVTGFVGVATSRVTYLGGCIQYCLIPKVDKDGKYIDGLFFDWQRLEYVDEGVGNSVEEEVKKEPTKRGGPSRGEMPIAR